ncbi:MAG: 50S ribosomal protein L19 [Pseudoxanthomonas suwonensis]|nr:MAG: 50S ribosomal protein L19 [Pseudoxanthomonas suwonensis]
MSNPSLNTLLQQFETEQVTRKLPTFGPGDTVVVNVKVKEGNRERVQAYEGVVIGVKNAGLNSSFTVRKISHGYGVERVFQSHSALIESVQVKRRGAVRAGKLYYLRGLEGKKARIREDLAATAKAKAARLAEQEASAIEAAEQAAAEEAAAKKAAAEAPAADAAAE